MPRVYARSPFMLNYLSPCYTQQDTREYFGKVVTPKFDRTVTVTHVAPKTVGAPSNMPRHMQAIIGLIPQIELTAEELVEQSKFLFDF